MERNPTRPAAALCKDINAVQAAIFELWFNRQTEGQTSKLEVVKRQMNGRAKIDLLGIRVTGVP